VKGLRSNPQHGFTLETTDGLFVADQVVIAAGGYQIPVIPRCAERLDPGLVQINSSEYRNPEQLPPGPVLVVGSGQSGCQIAEDLHLAARKVHLCIGDAPRVSRRYRGKDVVEWLHLMGYYDLPVHEHPLREGVRDKTNHYVTGRDGGRDIDLRLRAREGMELYGPLTTVDHESSRGDGIPDGLCVDVEGCLWVAFWGAGQIRRLAPDGAVLQVIDVPAPHTSSVAFVGPELDRLLITTARADLDPGQLAASPSSGRVFVTRVQVPGLPCAAWAGSSTRSPPPPGWTAR